MTARERLPNRRGNSTFDLELDGLRYTATVARFPDGRIAELFLNTGATAPPIPTREMRLLPSRLQFQHGADPEAIRHALSRDSHGHASGVLGAALDHIAGEESCSQPSSSWRNTVSKSRARRLAATMRAARNVLTSARRKSIAPPRCSGSPSRPAEQCIGDATIVAGPGHRRAAARRMQTHRRSTTIATLPASCACRKVRNPPGQTAEILHAAAG